MANAFKSPQIKIPRNRFDLSYSHKDTMNLGELVPFYIQEVYPGDTFNVKSTHVIRLTNPLIRPIMDNLFLDKYYFFVPNRIIYDNWEQLMGDNQDNYWNEREFNGSIPQVRAGSIGIEPGMIASHFGLPNGVSIHSVSALPFRAFAKIWNEWFRDQNTQAPVLIPTGQHLNDGTLVFNNYDWSSGNYLGMCPKINKLHDYFTSCLPEPQKGDSIDIINNNVYPVVPLDANVDDYFPLDTYFNGIFSEKITKTNNYSTYLIPKDFDDNPVSGTLGVDFNELGIVQDNNYAINESLMFRNLFAVNSNLDSVNDLRFKLKLQKMLELDARGGTRYVEIIENHFGVISPDQRLQRPEYLGGNRTPLNITQVTQTSQSSSDSPLAQVGAYSLSNGTSGFNKGFTEHGFIIGVCAVRQRHTYQQGIDKFWFRKDRYDFYDPIFANIGEQPVYTKEIDAKVTDGKDIFGYQEAWADLRSRVSHVCSELSSENNTGLDVWHLADYYENEPVLNGLFMAETELYLDRVLTVSSDIISQFIIDHYHSVSAVRPLPLYSIPSIV